MMFSAMRSIKKFWKHIKSIWAGVLLPMKPYRGKTQCRIWTGFMEDPDIPADAGISIEFQIPLTSKRIDFIITGLNEVQQEQVVIIELKQWSSAELTDKDALVKTRFQHGISETAHPSYQAWSYATLIKDYNQTVRDEQITPDPLQLISIITRRTKSSRIPATNLILPKPLLFSNLTQEN